MLAVLLGTAAMTAVASLQGSVVDRVGRELRSFGANITVTPAADGLPVSIGGVDYRPVSAGEYLEQDRLTSLKKIFWRHNIVSFAPFLYVPVRIRGTETVLIGTWFGKKLKIDEEEVFVRCDAVQGTGFPVPYHMLAGQEVGNIHVTTV